MRVIRNGYINSTAAVLGEVLLCDEKRRREATQRNATNDGRSGGCNVLSLHREFGEIAWAPLE